MSKFCEVCLKQIPDDYGNLLCDEHYEKLNNELDEKKKEETELTSVNLQSSVNIEPIREDGITEKDYKCNPQVADKEQVAANWAQFMGTGKFLWHHTRGMYEFIRDQFRQRILDHPQYPKFIWKPTVCDVGCGSGCGSNILSQEADFVWGVDKNAFSIKFAKELFERHKNNIYYCPQVTFDNIDIESEPRDLMTFDEIVAIEIIEHIDKYENLLTFIKRLCKKDKAGKYLEMPQGTRVWISTPNRNSDSIQKDHPKNMYHVREWTADEFYGILIKHFKSVMLYNWKGVPIELDSKDTPIFAKCEVPL